MQRKSFYTVRCLPYGSVRRQLSPDPPGDGVLKHTATRARWSLLGFRSFARENNFHFNASFMHSPVESSFQFAAV